jgi:glucose-1-phosphate thymidylyltransferase
MKIVIPMAGYGSRLRPHTYSRPKPLITIAGQPMLKHLLDSLAILNIEEYIFIVGYLGNQLEAYIKKTYDFPARFIYQETLSGQSPAINLARSLLDGPTLVLFADTLFETDLSVIQTTDADAIAFVKQVEDPRRFGVVEVDDTGKVTRFIEKPASMDNKNAVIGLYYIRDAAQMLRAIDTQIASNRMTKDEFYIADAFQIMIEQGSTFRTQSVSVWLDTGKPETVLETNRHLLGHGFANGDNLHREGIVIIPPVNIHPSATLKNVIIGPYVTIGENCKISDSIIRDSIVEAGATLQKTILDQSLIGERAEVIGQDHTVIVGDQSSIHFT